MTHKAGSRTLDVRALARVEGEGAMHVRVRQGRVADVELRIFEPPRLFEAFLRGRAWVEPPDITARICGICPVAYQLTACAAIEDACGVTVTEPIRALRRMLYCGEWIESHALHIYLLHAPDFLGYESAIDMARDHPDVVNQGLRLKKAGNALMSLIGGRAVHPVNVRVGGFYRFPSRSELLTLRDPLERAREDAIATVRLVAGFDFPEDTQPHEYLALRSDSGYPLEGGVPSTSGGSTFSARSFDEHVVEEHVPWSTALHARLAGARSFAVGPLARYALNAQALSPLARELAAEAGLAETCRNPFQSIVVRAVETLFACDEALRLMTDWDPAGPASVDVPARAGVGAAVTEAPRGLLYHRYRLAPDGTILDARIVPPTALNQAAIETDLREFVQPRLDLPDAELTRQCEQAIRNFDPCISCSAHFLDLTVERS